jgi:adenylate kinase
MVAPQSPRQVVLLLGGPGAGKSTQARLLSTELHLPHVSTGDLLRERERERERAATLARMASGDLLPDDLATEIVLQRLAQPDAERGAIVDGYPRTLAQAKALDSWLERHRGSILGAVYLDVPTEQLAERLQQRGRVGSRADDRGAAIPRRMQLFLHEVAPVLQHYANRDLLRRVDGTQPIEQVHRQIVQALAAPGGTTH